MDRLGRSWDFDKKAGTGFTIASACGAHSGLAVPLWDLRPEKGGSPIKLAVPSVDAKEFIERDPQRYIYAKMDEDAPPKGSV